MPKLDLGCEFLKLHPFSVSIYEQGRHAETDKYTKKKKPESILPTEDY